MTTLKERSRQFRTAGLVSLAGFMMLTACDGPNLAFVSACKDPVQVRAMDKAMIQLQRAEESRLKLRMGGASYVAAKIGLIDDPGIEHAMKRAAANMERAQLNLARAVARCSEMEIAIGK